MVERKLNRLTGFNYASEGYYFVTICTKDMREWFGKVTDRRMQLNRYGDIVIQQLLWLQKQYTYITLDEYIVMPNHMHSIIILHNVGTGRDLSLQVKRKPLSQIIGAFKTTSSKRIHESGFGSFQWQRSFYDHIIRTETTLNSIRNYIKYNSCKWDGDEYNPERYFNY